MWTRGMCDNVSTLVVAVAVRSSILSSGTVGAAVEASLMGVRGIALSFPFTKGFNNWTDNEVVFSLELW